MPIHEGDGPRARARGGRAGPCIIMVAIRVSTYTVRVENVARLKSGAAFASAWHACGPEAIERLHAKAFGYHITRACLRAAAG